MAKMTRVQKALLEAGEEDEAAEDEAASEEQGKEASRGAEDEGGNAEQDDEDSDLTSDEPFIGLDLRKARCFGFSVPEQSCWSSIAKQADDVGWKLIDRSALEKSLARDVEDSYMRIAQFKCVNVDDGISYELWFDNNKSLWCVEIANSPKAELADDERADFFKSELVKKIAKKTFYKLNAAKKIYDERVQPHLEDGELMLVDTVKLDAIISFLESERFLDNLLNCKYLNY